MKNIILFFFTILLFIGEAYPQEKDTEPVDAVYKGTRLVNGHSANVAEKGKLLMLIQHRFGEIDGGFYELFGLDQATMRLGFEYGFGDNFTAGFGRSSFYKTYDLHAKARVIQQNSFPLTVAVTLEGSVPTIRNVFPDAYDSFSDKFAGFVQLHLAHTFRQFSIEVSPGYLRTGYLPVAGENLTGLTTGFGASVKLSKKVALNAEYLAFFNSEMDNEMPLSIGVDVETGGHLFQLVLSNTQNMYTQGLYTSTNGNWADGKIYFGFNLIREFRIKYY